MFDHAIKDRSPWRAVPGTVTVLSISPGASTRRRHQHIPKTETVMARIGFIGLGNMGGPMARNLIKAGHGLKVYDLSEEAVSFVVQSGATAAESVKDAAAGVDVVIILVE